MEWYQILVLVVGGFGGATGLVAIFHAKSKKDTIDIGNMQQMLNEAHKMYDEMKLEKQEQAKEFHSYKEENEKRLNRLEARLDESENRSKNLSIAILQGYRCRLPQENQICPVIREYEKRNCDECMEKNY